MNAMEATTDAIYAKHQWEQFRDRIVHKENVTSLVIHEYFKSVDEMNRTRKAVRQWINN